ncbi:MAG: gliding motility protein GldN [Bacteroidales bacterium]|nr:gliding motility protein GldN [Bacteroidales bacterium]
MKKTIAIIVFAIVAFGFTTQLSAQAALDKNPNEGLYEQNATGFQRPMAYTSIREADVMWRKRIWREIDFRQKMNQVFFYPTETHYNWTNFITILMEAMKSGEIQAYQVDPQKDQLDTPYRYDAIKDQYFEKPEVDDDGNPVLDKETGEPLIKKTYDVVKKLRIMEDWYFDKQRSELKVQILAICPTMVDEGGNSEGLFWVSYNHNTREILAKSNFFNSANPGAPKNYDEIFMKRMFDSYIYKEENPYDRKINHYAQGEAALWESERIKQEIIDFEQNLWEY